MITETDPITETKKYIRRQRLKAWIYSGVEIELDMAKWDAENAEYLKVLDDEDAAHDEKIRAVENLKYNKQLLTYAFAQMTLVNKRIEELT